MGFGTLVKAKGGFHLVGEIFSGDLYVAGSGIAYQIGFRHFFSDLLQVDLSIGKGIAGDHPLSFWASAGVRIVFEKLAKKHASRQQPTIYKPLPISNNRSLQ